MKTEISGIKCDNPECDYEAMENESNSYEEIIQKFLNVPCPKCGTPLLVQEDIDARTTLLNLIETVEKIGNTVIVEGSDDEKEEVTMGLETDGKGNAKLILNFSKESIAKFKKINDGD